MFATLPVLLVLQCLFNETPTPAVIPTPFLQRPLGDKLPDNFREYFERVDAVRSESIKKTETQIADRRIDLRGASPAAQGKLKLAIKRLESQLATQQKSRAYAFLPLIRPSVDQIGVLPRFVLTKILDEHTAIGNTEVNATAVDVVLTRVETKGLKAGFVVDSRQYWRTAALHSDDEAITRHRNAGSYYLIVEPIQSEEVDHFAKLYDRENSTAKKQKPQ